MSAIEVAHHCPGVGQCPSSAARVPGPGTGPSWFVSRSCLYNSPAVRPYLPLSLFSSQPQCVPMSLPRSLCVCLPVCRTRPHLCPHVSVSALAKMSVAQYFRLEVCLCLGLGLIRSLGLRLRLGQWWT